MRRSALPDAAALHRGFCEAQAVLCEGMAGEAVSPRLAAEWRLMAREWRAAAPLPSAGPANDNA